MELMGGCSELRGTRAGEDEALPPVGADHR